MTYEKMYMLDTNINSFIMREPPEAILKRGIVASAITYAEMRFGATTLRLAGTRIGPNDTANAGHAIAAGAVL